MCVVYAVVPAFLCIQNEYIRTANDDETAEDPSMTRFCSIDTSVIPEASKVLVKFGTKFVIKTSTFHLVHTLD